MYSYLVGLNVVRAFINITNNQHAPKYQNLRNKPKFITCIIIIIIIIISYGEGILNVYVCSTCIFKNINKTLWSETLFVSIFLLMVTSFLLITFANSLNQDQKRQNVGPDLDPKRLTL